MSLYRWSLGVLLLGATLLTLGVVPELLAFLLRLDLPFTLLLLVSVAPLGAATVLIGLVLLLVSLPGRR